MKTIVHHKYGPPRVLQIEEAEKPVPADDEVLVKVAASTVTLFDCWQRSGSAPPGFKFLSRIDGGFFRPRKPVPGTDFSGQVESVGREVKNFRAGDPVYGFTGFRAGAYAEYLCISENDMICRSPGNLSAEQSASIPQGALTALYFLRQTGIRNGSRVLVFGASGGVGIFAVQLARYFGAEVTGVCSGEKSGFVRSLGAVRTIDYKQADFRDADYKYDVIFDTIGKCPLIWCEKSLKPGGTFVFTTFGLLRFFRILGMKGRGRINIGALGVVEEKPEDLEYLRDMAERGIIKPVIDSCFPMQQAAEAHTYSERGRKKGHVIIRM